MASWLRSLLVIPVFNPPVLGTDETVQRTSTDIPQDGSMLPAPRPVADTGGASPIPGGSAPPPSGTPLPPAGPQPPPGVVPGGMPGQPPIGPPAGGRPAAPPPGALPGVPRRP